MQTTTVKIEITVNTEDLGEFPPDSASPEEELYDYVSYALTTDWGHGPVKGDITVELIP